MIEPALKDEAFLADVEQAKLQTEAIHLWWLGQSGILLQWSKKHLVFDPYLSDSLTHKYANTEKPHVRMSRRVVAPEKLTFIDVITSSHNHTDHLDADTLLPMVEAIANRGSFFRPGGDPRMVIAEANRGFVANRLKYDPDAFTGMNAGETRRVEKFKVSVVPAAHDALEIDETGRHKYVGYVVQSDAMTVYHSGDTVVYPGMVELLRPHNIDIAILPINGKLGNMNGVDAARLAKDIGAKVVIPCHYDMFEFNTADPYEQFVPECERIGQAYRVLKLGERFTYPESGK